MMKEADLAEGWFITGLLHDYLGNSSKAHSCYIKSVEIFDRRIINPDKHEQIEANKLNRAISLIFIVDREKEGRAELERLKNSVKLNSIMLDDLLHESKEELMYTLIGVE